MSSKEGPSRVQTLLWWMQCPASRIRIENPVCKTHPTVVLSREWGVGQNTVMWELRHYVPLGHQMGPLTLS